MWRSLVARFVRDEEVVGSNPATPTHEERDSLLSGVPLFMRRALARICEEVGPQADRRLPPPQRSLSRRRSQGASEQSSTSGWRPTMINQTWICHAVRIGLIGHRRVCRRL